MAYENPSFGIRHVGAEVGVAKITTKYGTLAGFGKERLIDYRGAQLMKFAAAQSDHDVEFDRGTGLGLDTFDTLVIPPGHNLVSGNVEVYSGATSPAATLRGTGGVAAGWLEVPFTAAADRYFRVKFTANAAHELGELWLTKKRAPTTGIVRDWQAPLLTPRNSIEFPSREVVSLLATPRRRLLLEHQGLVEGSTDEILYYELLLSGVALPFLFWPPISGSPNPWIARLEEDAERTQDHPQPKTAVAYTYSLALREQLL